MFNSVHTRCLKLRDRNKRFWRNAAFRSFPAAVVLASCNQLAGIDEGRPLREQDAGSGGTPLPSAGSGGTPSQGEGGGSAGTHGGSGGSAGSGECIDCLGEPTIRLGEMTATPSFGAEGGGLYFDVCPDNQILVGFEYHTFDAGDTTYLTGLRLHCAALELDDAEPNGLSFSQGLVQNQRGGGAGVRASTLCPPGEVVVGYAANTDDEVVISIAQLIVHCAPLHRSLSKPTLIQFGETYPLPASGSRPGLFTYPLQACPAGQVARGARIRAGSWVDSFGLLCAAIDVAAGEGAACTQAAECQSNVCEGTCQPIPCPEIDGCVCRMFVGRPYMFCSVPATYQTATDACNARGSSLVHVDDYTEHGWVRATATGRGVSGSFWLGADDINVEGTWMWRDDASPVAPPGLWENWEPSGSPDEHCMESLIAGTWNDNVCGASLPYVCEPTSNITAASR